MDQRYVIIPAVSLGLIAEKLLQQQASAIPFGISSKGIYLRTPDDWNLFLSYEKFRGPLTVNLSGEHATIPTIRQDSRVTLDPSKITFPDNGLQINLADTQVWNKPLPSGKISAEISRIRLMKGLEQALKITEGNEYRGLLLSILNNKSLPGSFFPGFDKPLSQFLAAIKPGELRPDDLVLSGLLGLGPGLTPLGDDIILGAILTMNRWGKILRIEVQLENLNTQLLQTARLTTSTLSANLLTSAIEGFADERLLAVLDSFFTGDESTQADLEKLLKWGSSSGIAVLAGMTAVITRLL
ncbi:MAG: DUF2877 domain-containing protein [Anaerolineales bacterium]|nr:DUF2877 domain-containing protein [Anaerolineales bacterium]